MPAKNEQMETPTAKGACAFPMHVIVITNESQAVFASAGDLTDH